MPVRSLPAAQWKIAGSAPGAAEAADGGAEAGPAVGEHVGVGAREELDLRVGRGRRSGGASSRHPGRVDDGLMDELDRHAVDREGARARRPRPACAGRSPCAARAASARRDRRR